jgi:hypothetical protein
MGRMTRPVPRKLDAMARALVVSTPENAKHLLPITVY